MPTAAEKVRPLTSDDLEWVLDLSEGRRERIVSFGPVLWRPAPDARDRHRAFLAQQIENPSVVSMRTAHGFVFAAPRGDLLDVDDMALDDDDLWPHDGSALLRSVLEIGDLRFVCPIPDPRRRRTAVELGMVLVESWWHRELALTSSPTVGGAAAIQVGGACGRLVAAPPVYAPGGPVLVTSDVDGGPALTELESAAASRGAVVSVVPRKPGQPTDLLTSAGYKRTTDFFVWRR